MYCEIPTCILKDLVLVLYLLDLFELHLRASHAHAVNTLDGRGYLDVFCQKLLDQLREA